MGDEQIERICRINLPGRHVGHAIGAVPLACVLPDRPYNPRPPAAKRVVNSSHVHPDHEGNTSVDIAIIGAGAAGVLLATHLLDRRSPARTISLIGKAEAIGEGAAYATRHAEHLLNVTSNRMSAFDDKPDDFVEFLAEQDDGAFARLSAQEQKAHFAERRDGVVQ